jgi:phosphatidylglycerophosphatase C
MTVDSQQSSASTRPVVAFDFDGTLTTADSFTAFLAWRVARPRHLLGLLRLVPAALLYLRDRDRGRIKAAAVHEFLCGVPRAALEAQAETFARAESARMFRPDALEAWRRWGAQGAFRVIVTASPETTVAPFARILGADRLIGTRLAFDSEGRVAGVFDGANCRGPEKVRRLREAFGDDLRLAAAYGDTAGDHEMLQIAEAKGYRVFKERP